MEDNMIKMITYINTKMEVSLHILKNQTKKPVHIFCFFLLNAIKFPFVKALYFSIQI